MRKFILKKRFSLPETIALVSIAIICVSVVSYAVTVPNTFTSGTTAKSSEVNANFAALVNAVTALETQVTTLQADLTTAEGDITAAEGNITTLQTDLTTAEGNITTLQTDLTTAEGDITTLDGRLDTVESNNALLLDPYLTITPGTINGLAGPHAILTGANLHIRSGGGSTDAAVNGLGNLLVGYNEGPTTLNPGDRGGSHTLIVGSEHKYLSYGGFVAGNRNTVGLFCSSVSGGSGNEANAQYSSISGGFLNTASVIFSSVSGGSGNIASDYCSSVSGGRDNEASGFYSSVSGGSNNAITNNYEWRACDIYSCIDAP